METPHRAFWRIVWVLALASCAAAQGKAKTHVSFEEKQLAIVPGDVVPCHLTFSPDGRKVAYGARQGRELWWKVIDVK